MNTKLSIIVPVYNAQKYLEQCITSIKEQTYSYWELILVDDGSKDDSGKICDAAKTGDERVKVIHKSNGGVSSARNTGVKNATGKYIFFVDADDILAPGYIESFIVNDEIDLVIGGYTSFGVGHTVYELTENRNFDIRDFSKLCFILQENKILNVPFAKMYRREIIESFKLLFREDVALGEDALFNLSYIQCCNTIQLISNAMYNYRVTADSASRKYRDKDFEQIETVYLESMNFAKKYNADEGTFDKIAEFYLVSSIGTLQLLCFSNIPYRDKKKVINELLKNLNFGFVCKKTYNLTRSYKVVQALCQHRSSMCIICFFCIKKIALSVRNIDKEKK